MLLGKNSDQTLPALEAVEDKLDLTKTGPRSKLPWAGSPAGIGISHWLPRGYWVLSVRAGFKGWGHGSLFPCGCYYCDCSAGSSVFLDG